MEQSRDTLRNFNTDHPFLKRFQGAPRTLVMFPGLSLLDGRTRRVTDEILENHSLVETTPFRRSEKSNRNCSDFESERYCAIRNRRPQRIACETAEQEGREFANQIIVIRNDCDLRLLTGWIWIPSKLVI